MRNSSLNRTMLMLSLLAVVLNQPARASSSPGESFVYDSEDMFGGGSYLGVNTRDITPDRLGPLQLKEENGVEVTLVDQDAPAAKAGVKEHDVILNINGQQVESVEQLRRLIHEIPAGRVVTIGVSRNGQPLTLKAQLAARKTFGPDIKSFNIRIPPIPPIPPIPDIDIPVSIVVVHSSTRSGLMVENLTPQLSDFFGAKGGQGILVRSVEKGSRAEKAGFRAGDVIIRINGEPISDAGDFTHALHSRKDNSVSVTILRDRKEQTLSLPLPEHKQGYLEESFGPEIGAETREEMNATRAELAEIQPALANQARALADEGRKAARELGRQHDFQLEMRQMRRSLHDQQEQLRKQLRELKRGADI